MESFATGWPDLWAIIDKTPYIIGDCGWDTETEKTQVGGMSIVHARSITGYAKLFGKDALQITDSRGVPDPVGLQIIGHGERRTFKQTLFSKIERIDHYENVAVEVEWVADTVEKGMVPERFK